MLEFVTALYAAYGVLDGLLERERTGRGRKIEVSMLGAGLAFMSEPMAMWETTGELFSARSRPSYSQAYTFVCRDSEIITLHLSSSDENWRNLLVAVGSPPELADPSRFGDRQARIVNFETIQRTLRPIFATGDRDSWVEKLDHLGVPCAPMNRVDQLRNDPQVRALGIVKEIPQSGTTAKFALVGSPVAVSDGAPAESEMKLPALGEHTERILSRLGYSAAEVADLVDSGVAVQWRSDAAST